MIGRGRGVGGIREADGTEDRTGDTVDEAAGLSQQMAGGTAGGQAGAGEEKKAEAGHEKQIRNEWWERGRRGSESGLLRGPDQERELLPDAAMGRRISAGGPDPVPGKLCYYCYSPQRAGPAMEMAPVGRWILMRVEEAVAVTRLVADAKLASPRSVRTWLPEW